jgi:hypothetical protein
MKKPDILAKCAAFVVVLSGSTGVGLSCYTHSYELATASASFACVGLYFLFGKMPPSTGQNNAA